MRQHLLLLLSLALAVVLTDGVLIDCFLRAIGITRTPAKVVYSELGLSQTQWSRQINGAEPPRFLARLARLSNPNIVRWYSLLIIDQCGLPSEVETGQRVKRMAKAALCSSTEERRVS